MAKYLRSDCLLTSLSVSIAGADLVRASFPTPMAMKGMIENHYDAHLEDCEPDGKFHKSQTLCECGQMVTLHCPNCGDEMFAMAVPGTYCPHFAEFMEKIGQVMGSMN